MVNVYGVSHVSEQSIDLIREKIEQHNPDIVALELDAPRLNALLSDKNERSDSLFGEIIRRFQRYIGSKTGVMPGEEMVFAYRECGRKDIEVALIDQNIAITLRRLKDVRRKEKVRAALSIFGGLLFPRKFDFNDIPSDSEIDLLLEETKDRFPEIHRVLVEERNVYMAEALKHLQRNNAEKDIIAFVGAGHRDEIQRKIDEENLQRNLVDFTGY